MKTFSLHPFTVFGDGKGKEWKKFLAMYNYMPKLEIHVFLGWLPLPWGRLSINGSAMYSLF